MSAKRKKRLLSTAAAATATVVVAMSLPTAAFADNTGGTGGSDAGWGGGSNWRWVATTGISNAKGTEPNSAYQRFMNKAGYGTEYNEIYLKATGANLNTCKVSSAIWWVENGQGKWSHNFTGATHGPNKRSVFRSIDNPAAVYNASRSPNSTEVSSILAWAAKQGGKLNGTPGFTILCSGHVGTKERVVNKTESKTQNVSNRQEKTAIHSYITTVAPQGILEANGVTKRRGVDNNLVSQTATVRTNFGKLYDEILKENNDSGNASSDMTPAQVKAKIDAALAKDKNIAHASVNLNSANKEGMAAGGILNVTEFEKDTTIVYNQIQGQISTRKQTCDQMFYADGTKGPLTNCSWSSWTPWSTTSRSNYARTDLETMPETSGWYQMLSVNCNPEQFSDLVTAVAENRNAAGQPTGTGFVSDVQTTGNSDGSVSGTIILKELGYVPMDRGAPAALGDRNHHDPHKNATANISFFTQDCSIQCTMSKSTSQGASNLNGATSNKGNGATINESPVGAKANSAGSASLFRDNNENSLFLDVWYPSKSNVDIDYDGRAPKSTTVVRDPEGTPGLTPNVADNEGGQFTMEAIKGSTTKKLFTGNDSVEKLNGLYRDFDLSATWASEPEKPQIIETSWEYDVNTNFKMYTTLGFDTDGSELYSNLSTFYGETVTRCFAAFGSDISDGGDKISIENGDEHDELLFGKDKISPHNMFIDFVRSTTK